jgi:hypothetical protein
VDRRDERGHHVPGAELMMRAIAMFLIGSAAFAQTTVINGWGSGTGSGSGNGSSATGYQKLVPNSNTSTTSEVLFIGDSHMAGFGQTTPISAQISTSQTYHVDNIAVSATKFCAYWADNSTHESQVDAYFNPLARTNIIVIEGGGNDGIDNNTGNPAVPWITAQQVFDCQVSYIKRRKAVGWKVVLYGMYSRNQSAIGGLTADQFKTQLNGLYASNWKSFADAYVNVGADANVGANGAYSNTTFFQADGIHIQSSYTATLASLTSTAINQAETGTGILQGSGAVSVAGPYLNIGGSYYTIPYLTTPTFPNLTGWAIDASLGGAAPTVTTNNNATVLTSLGNVLYGTTIPGGQTTFRAGMNCTSSGGFICGVALWSGTGASSNGMWCHVTQNAMGVQCQRLTGGSYGTAITTLTLNIPPSNVWLGWINATTTTPTLIYSADGGATWRNANFSFPALGSVPTKWGFITGQDSVVTILSLLTQ